MTREKIEARIAELDQLIYLTQNYSRNLFLGRRPEVRWTLDNWKAEKSTLQEIIDNWAAPV